jgi:P4 family phage/plasmid primase-like protien
MNAKKNYKNLTDFLINHVVKKGDKNCVITHTRICNKENNIYGGAYTIEENEYEEFMDLYYEDVLIKNKNEYLTEKQQIDSETCNGPILVDFDFRYNSNVFERQHDEEFITNICCLYSEELKKFFDFKPGDKFSIYIMEKPNINKFVEKDITKDGIHMIIGIQMNHIMQEMLRNNILKEVTKIDTLPLINDWDNVLDFGITKGTTNWQMFGSKKPNNEAYQLTNHYVLEFDNDGEFIFDKKGVNNFDFKNNFKKLSAQYKNNPVFPKNPKIMDEYNKLIGKVQTKQKNIKNIKSKIKFIVNDEDEDDNEEITLENITSFEILEKAINKLFKNLKSSEYYLKEIHEYTQILPEKYYNPGSHTLNRHVAFALKNTDERLFLSWIMLRSKAEDFNYSEISKLYNDWKKYFNNKPNCITKRSIIFWAKQDVPEEYEKVKRKTIGFFIDETLHSPTEFDFAIVLYELYKDKYVCSSILNKQWYVFKHHKWELDNGHSLRLSISQEMFALYNNKLDEISLEISLCDDGDTKKEFLLKKINKISDISLKLKKTSDKNNIIREAMELFYDNDFNKNINSNPYLLGFTNGVIDFKEKIFRDGNPNDYITKSTNIDYINYKDEKYTDFTNQILSFIEQLYPINELNKYMWDHLASCLIGTNTNQTFNIYKGSGSNGKSRLMELMTHTLGDYKGTVPITLITEKRTIIGGTSSEIMQLKGVRYAVMQEPSKGLRINEGILKELVGGDPLQGRSLYCQSEVFQPQFTLVCCANVDFDFYSTDDGTWRRIRRVPHMAKFVDDSDVNTDDTPYIFPKDVTIQEKFPKWAPVFASMLVEHVFVTNGIVKDCDIVLAESKKYKESQDHITAFVNEYVIKTNDLSASIKKRELIEQFKEWFSENASHDKAPKNSEINEYMDKRFGKCKNNKWIGVMIKYEKESEENF